ncbi:hypothetical protein L1987_74121 [Smallanthus sonchifolius]|uniref:Uncharacterized protein n=1 Tax=Smallanthus sonchifolius TaxID=185202 RepID=A0ACB9A1X7_9ASTR|nr:hypothetical protein L1987_74121 [Smallanthus sonchifolius]
MIYVIDKRSSLMLQLRNNQRKQNEIHNDKHQIRNEETIIFVKQKTKQKRLLRFRIKPILDDKSELSAVRQLLFQLKQMAVSMKVLETTMIGKSVSSLQSHASPQGCSSEPGDLRLQNPRKSIVLDNKKSVEEKLEATKRKLEEGYKEAHNAKRLRRTQVIEVGDVLRLGLVPKQQQAL